MKFAQLVEDLMTKHGWTEEQLAKKARVNQSTISRILTGESSWPRESTVRKLEALANGKAKR